MDTKDLQRHLFVTKRYAGEIDGRWGKLTDGGVLLALTDGPDTALKPTDFDAAGARLDVQPAAIHAFWATEAAGAGFQNGRPKILPERHRFSRVTNGFYDKTNPALSNRVWDKSWYPRTQDARYDVLLAWGRLLSASNASIEAAFAACSYGAPQILGENAGKCGYTSAFMFAEAMARDEQTQLRAFETFVTSTGILPWLRKVDRTEKSWDPVSSRYNGSAFRENGYSGTMLANFIKFGGK